MAEKPIVFGIFSDPHAGSVVGLCPPDGPRTDSGQVVQPSKFQLWNWRNFEHFVGRVDDAAKALKVRPWWACNGDLTEGVGHHGTTETMTTAEDGQNYIARRIFDPIALTKPAKVFLIRGTTSHVGEPGRNSEEAMGASLAHKLPIIKEPNEGNWTHWRLSLDCNGTFIDFQHHGKGISGLPWTAPGAIARLAFRIWCEFAERGWRPPDLAIRSHLHQYRDSFQAHKVRAIITPAWQAKTSYTHNAVPESIADFGGLIVTCWPTGGYDVKVCLYSPDPIVPWKP